MRLPRAIRRLFRRRPAPPAAEPKPPEPSGPQRVRRWEAGRTHRLNEAHWKYAYGHTINEDLLERLESLRIRCEHEIANNGIVEGMLGTFAHDVVGPDGPRLQVQSDNTNYNTAVEEAVGEYSECPNPRVRATLADTLRVDVRSLMSAGEFIHQYARARREGPFDFAIRSPHPRRLESPGGLIGLENMFMGLELNPDQNSDQAVLRYHFRNERPGILARADLSWKPVDAENIQHNFTLIEQDQLRGVPWLAVCLDAIADVRDLDKYVIEAAKNAAAQGVVWWTNHPDVDLWEGIEERSYEPGIERTGPPGWQPTMINSTQPSERHKEHRHDRMREFGRPFGMPLMMILLSSEGNSFSGANHDGQIYIRTVSGVQAWMGASTVIPQIKQIAAEVRIAKGLPAPKKVSYVLTWPKPPHPDPKKNYEALRMQLEDGALDLASVCAALGRDFETVAQARKYVFEKLDELELAQPPVNYGHANGRPSGQLRDIADELDEEATETDPDRERDNERQLVGVGL